ncbi:hypothetical protein Indivirus_3_26 [Indivirus ILV1]|uniref:Uncharacterized protein n=1 Tax=Indivirus ILV1 TaxID=1977633 RepID=A0A1V0SDI7_9VIRU|nr:hypothetical protein Indivirus_3_26 [Indivirus ILV1]
MESKDLVINALRYYDKNNEKYSNFFRKVKYISFKIAEKDLDYSIVTFYDKNKKEILKSRYEFISIYNPSVGVWIWGWANPDRRKNEISLIKKVLTYGIGLDRESFFLKSELITSRFKITNDLQLDMHLAIASYISKEPCVMPIIDNGEEGIKHNNEYLLRKSDEINENTISINYLYLLDVPSKLYPDNI